VLCSLSVGAFSNTPRASGCSATGDALRVNKELEERGSGRDLIQSGNLKFALGPGVYSASNRNEYQKQKNNVSWE
jgi:hypothetical protein